MMGHINRIEKKYKSENKKNKILRRKLELIDPVTHIRNLFGGERYIPIKTK